MNFEELQKAWQNQEAPALKKNPQQSAGQENILDQVKKLQRKVIISNILMSVCLVLTGLFLGFMWYKATGESAWYAIGMGLVFAAMILTAGIIWLRSVPWGNLSPDLSSREYINQALKSFKFRQTTLRYIMPAYLFLLYLGISFIYLAIFEEASLQTRIWVHLGLTVFMALIGGLSLYYHRLKYQDKFNPVMKDLEELQQELGQE